MTGIWMEATLKLEPEECAILRKAAERESRPVTEFIRELIRRTLKQEGRSKSVKP